MSVVKREKEISLYQGREIWCIIKIIWPINVTLSFPWNDRIIFLVSSGLWYYISPKMESWVVIFTLMPISHPYSYSDLSVSLVSTVGVDGLFDLSIERPILDHHPKAHIHEIWWISPWNPGFHEIREIWRISGEIQQISGEIWRISGEIHPKPYKVRRVFAETSDFIRFGVDFMKSGGFHVKSKDLLQGIVTLCFYCSH